MSLNNSESLRFIPFIDPADEWAVTQILQLTTETQLSIAMRLLGLVRNAGGEYRKLSLERIRRERGHSKPSVRGTKDQMVAAGLLVELKAPGRSSLYGLGPEFAGPRYMQLVEQHAELAAADQLQWPFNEAQRAGGRKPADSSNRSSRTTTQERPGNSELPTTRKLRVTPRPGNSELPTPGNSELPPIETLRDIPLENSSREGQSEPSSSSFIQGFFQGQPSAEVDPQASGLSASSPAEISEQPEQPKQPSAEINTPPAVEGDHVLEEYPSLIPVEASSLAKVEPCSPELNARLRKAFGDEEQIWLNSETTSNSSQPFMVEGHSPGLGLVVLAHPSERYYGFRLESLGPDGLLLRNQSSVDQCNRIVEGVHSAVDRQACLTN